MIMNERGTKMNKKIVLLGTLTLCITTASLAMEKEWELLEEKNTQLHNDGNDKEWEKLDDDNWNNPSPREKKTTLKNLKKKKGSANTARTKKSSSKHVNDNDDTDNDLMHPIAENKEPWHISCQEIKKLLCCLCLNCE